MLVIDQGLDQRIKTGKVTIRPRSDLPIPSNIPLPFSSLFHREPGLLVTSKGLGVPSEPRRELEAGRTSVPRTPTKRGPIRFRLLQEGYTRT